MSTSANYNNTSIPYGVRLETFVRAPTIASSPGSFSGGTSQGVYVCENLTLNRKARIIRRYDETGGPNGSVGVPDFDEGSATVQLQTTSSHQLQRGDCFADTFDSSTGAESWVVTEVDQPEGQNEYKKMNVKFIKLY